MIQYTPEQIEAKKRLAAIRREGETFFERRMQEIYAAGATGLSDRAIAYELAVSPQTIGNWKKADEERAERGTEQ